MILSVIRVKYVHMYEGANFNLGGPDFSDLAPAPPKTPEVKKNDDDDLEEDNEKPKSLLEYLKKDSEKKDKEDSKKPEKETETQDSDEVEGEVDEIEDEVEDDEMATTEDGELNPDEVEMSNEEEQEVTSAILENRNEEIHEEADNAQTPEAKDEALAAGVFVEATKQAVDEGMTVDEAIDTGKAVAFEVLEIEEPEPETEHDDGTELEPEPEPTTPEAEIPDPIDIESLDEEDDPDPTSGATSSSGTSPPVPPVPPTTFGGVGPGSYGGGPVAGPGGALPVTHNRAPTTTTEVEPSSRTRNARYLLVGGIVGYLVGRRRGRIKTEKKLLPIQHKLEKEVSSLHGKIAWHEASVRAMVQEQMAKKPETVETNADRQKRTEKQKNEHSPNSRSQELDSNQKLGKFGLAGERTASSETFKTPEKLKPVDLMSVPELLALAEKIEIEQSTVKKLYETNRLNYEGLRRIVRAYLQGERLDKIVRENLLSPEKYAYPETLKTNKQSEDQANIGGGGADSNSSVDTNVLQNPDVTSTLPALPTDISQLDQKTKTNNPQKYGVIVGAIIATILLIYLISR